MSTLQYNFNDDFYCQDLLHTPEGVRDIYGMECATKLKIEDTLHRMLKLYGFKDIQTPVFEFFDIFSKERGTVSSKDMYKFFDKENNTLVLRPDITPSIARCVGKYYKEEDIQVRLCYIGNTFVNNTSYQGKLKEVTQVGAELINDGSADADAEMIALTIECLLKNGLKEFKVDVGHADLFNGIVEEAMLTIEEVCQLKILMENKNLFGVEEMISGKDLDEDLKKLIIKLPELFGDREHLTYVTSLTKNSKVQAAIVRLEKLYSLLESYGLHNYITFDLGMLSKYNYYTGIIFKAYTYGTGDAVATGGRYDNLLYQFGKEAEAIGMVIVTDQLLLALNRQKIKIPIEEQDTMILYHTDERKMAISLANQFRSQGIPTRLVRKFKEKDLQSYKNYGKRNGFGGILYVENAKRIQVMNLLDDSVQMVNPSEILKK